MLLHIKLIYSLNLINEPTTANYMANSYGYININMKVPNPKSLAKRLPKRELVFDIGRNVNLKHTEQYAATIFFFFFLMNKKPNNVNSKRAKRAANSNNNNKTRNKAYKK